MSVLVPAPYFFYYYSFIVWIETREQDVSSFIFFLRIALTIWGLLSFYINFRIICSRSEKNAMGIFIQIAL